MNWRSVLVKGGLLTAKKRDKDVAFNTLRDAMNHDAECCGVFCCKGASSLNLPDRTTEQVGQLYWENNVLMVRRPDGTTATVTLT